MSYAFAFSRKRMGILATIVALAILTISFGWNAGFDGFFNRPSTRSRVIEARQAEAIYYAGMAQPATIRKKIHSPSEREYQKEESLQPTVIRKTVIRKKILIQTENQPEEFTRPGKINDSAGSDEKSIIEMEPEQKNRQQPAGEFKIEAQEPQPPLPLELGADGIELSASVSDEKENEKKIEFENINAVPQPSDISIQEKIIRIDYGHTASAENDSVIKESGYFEKGSLHPYSIMLSSCRRWSSVPKLLSDYRKMGLSACFVKVDLGESGIWWRIFLGSYKTREEAQRIKQIHDLSESIVKKMPYANLIDDFSSEAEATAMIRHLEGLQYSPYLIQHDPNRFQLLVGAFITREGASELKSDLHSEGIPNKVIER